MANKKSLQILRGTASLHPEHVLLDGQPFYDKESGWIYVGNSTSKLSELKGITAPAEFHDHVGTMNVTTKDSQTGEINYHNTVDITNTAAPQTLMFRDPDGRCCVEGPTDNEYHVANKGYVDGMIQNAVINGGGVVTRDIYKKRLDVYFYVTSETDMYYIGLDILTSDPDLNFSVPQDLLDYFKSKGGLYFGVCYRVDATTHVPDYTQPIVNAHITANTSGGTWFIGWDVVAGTCLSTNFTISQVAQITSSLI